MIGPLLFASTALSSVPIEVDTWAQTLKEIDHPRALIFVDIDETLIDFKTYIGCKQWRAQIKGTSLKNYHDVLTLHIAKNVRMIPVEEETPQIIKELQEQGHFIFPLTARERDCWYDLAQVPGVDELTYQALLQAGMDFAQMPRPPYFDQMNQVNFYKGIYFSKHPIGSEVAKGETLKELLAPLVGLQDIGVYFIDDKREQGISVLAAMQELGIPAKAFWYRAFEKNGQDFNFAASLIQLEDLLFNNKLLSNQQASQEAAIRRPPTPDQLVKNIILRPLKIAEN